MNPTDSATAFLTMIKEGKVNKAYDGLVEGSLLKSDQPKVVESMKKQTRHRLPKFGDILGFELLDQRSFGDSLNRLIFLVKSVKHPTVWVFHYYRPKDAWTLISVNFGEQLGVLETVK